MILSFARPLPIPGFIMINRNRKRITDSARGEMVEDLLDLDPSFPARLDRLVYRALLGLMILTVLAFGTVEYWAIAIFGLAVLLLFLAWGMRVAMAPSLQVSFPLLLLPLLVVAGYGLLQVMPRVDAAGRHWTVSMDPESTWLVVEVLLILLTAGFLFANLFRTPHRLLVFRNFLTVFGLLYSIFALINHFTWNGRYFWIFEPSVVASHPFGSFVNHNHFAGYVEMLVPLPVALVLTRSIRGELALLNGFAALMMSVASIVSLSRGGMLSLLSGLMMVVILGLRPAGMTRRGYSRPWAPALTRLGAMLVILAILTAGVLWVGADGVLQRLEIESGGPAPGEMAGSPAASALYESRGFIWQDTWRMIRANWVYGVGLGAFQTAYPIYSLRDRFHLVGQAHNDYLQALADGGILTAGMALLYLMLLIRFGRRAISHPDPALAGLAIGCLSGIFALLVHSLFDFNLQLISNSLLFLALSMVVWRIGRMTMNRRVSPGLIPTTQIDEDDSLVLLEKEVWS